MFSPDGVVCEGKAKGYEREVEALGRMEGTGRVKMRRRAPGKGKMRYVHEGGRKIWT